MDVSIVKPLPESYHEDARQVQMDGSKRIKKKIWIILLVGLVLEVLFDPLSSLLQWGGSLQARIGMPYARRKWDSQGITHYKFHIQGAIPMACLFGGNVEVKDGQVIHTSVEHSDLDLGFALMEDPPLCNYRNYNMPRLFDQVQRSVSERPFSTAQISFDPKYGFVSRYGFSSCGGHGLLSPRIRDCSGGFTIEDFQILDE
jgi:hypothetical protein